MGQTHTHPLTHMGTLAPSPLVGTLPAKPIPARRPMRQQVQWPLFFLMHMELQLFERAVLSSDYLLFNRCFVDLP